MIESMTVASFDADYQLLEAVQKGDRHAFSQLVEQYHSLFFRIAYRIVRNHADAEDIVQDCFVTLWRRPQLWNPDKGARFTTWFTRIIINRALNLQTRRKNHQPDLLDQLPDNRSTSDEAYSSEEERRWLITQLSKLPDNQRTALNLCLFEDYSNQDAADVMGCSLSAVKSLLSRARHTLKIKYERWNNIHERPYERARH